MDNVSRPLIAVLLATVAFFALWLVALKPSSSSTTGKPGGLGAYQSAINRAHKAVATANAASAAEGGKVATTPAAGSSARPAVAPSTRAKPVAHPATVRAAAGTPAGVARALSAGKVLALLFYNPVATDDRAVKQELASVPSHRGRVVKLALPLNDLARYSVVTDQVSVTVSPTLVVINRNHQASTIVGFADRFEIAQRVADALG